MLNQEKIKGTLLLVYYHPVVFDLAFAFSSIFEKVEICVTNDLKDNYGTHQNVIEKAKLKGFEAYLSTRAVVQMRAKKYALVGLDGVFQGDKLLIDACNSLNLPYFCINGYPHNVDEPSKNILSFSWYLPEKHYRAAFPSEAHVKQIDWANIAKGVTSGKNICVYYPPFRELKKWWLEKNFSFRQNRQNSGSRIGISRDEFVSFIHRFEECNKESFEVFKRLQSRVSLNNYSNLSSEEVWMKMHKSYGLIHMKHADCPGISLLESMLLARVPIVMRSFILASQNQDLLIDEHTAIICDTIDELIERTMEYMDEVASDPSCNELEESTQKHAWMLTDEGRQQRKLRKFVENCLCVK
jgi:hypothetical protein